MRAERLVGGAKKKARESDVSYLPRMTDVEKLNSVARELKKMIEYHYGLMVGLPLTQN